MMSAPEETPRWWKLATGVFFAASAAALADLAAKAFEHSDVGGVAVYGILGVLVAVDSLERLKQARGA